VWDVVVLVRVDVVFVVCEPLAVGPEWVVVVVECEPLAVGPECVVVEVECEVVVELWPAELDEAGLLEEAGLAGADLGADF